MISNSRYMLERYRQGGRNRYDCPGCGKHKCFTRYVDIETGYYLADDCGKCDHENSCGYHYPPRELFGDHPELRPMPNHECIGGGVAILSRPSVHHHVAKEETSQSEFFPLEWAEQAIRRPCTFTTWLRSLPLDSQRLDEVLDMYFVGGTRDHYHADGIDCGPAVVFWQIDEMLRPHDAKVMAYGTDGHRKGHPNWLRAICVKKGEGPQLERTDKVLFGQHLLNRYPDKAVCIVESEKSALICACRYPQYLWMASGGCGYLNAEKIRPLKKRRVVLFPDSGEYTQWKSVMTSSGHSNYHVDDLMEAYEPNTDIADIILGEAVRKDSYTDVPSSPHQPTDKASLWAQLKEAHPSLKEMERIFDVEDILPLKEESVSSSQTASLDTLNSIVTNPKQHSYENDR